MSSAQYLNQGNSYLIYDEISTANERQVQVKKGRSLYEATILRLCRLRKNTEKKSPLAKPVA